MKWFSVTPIFPETVSPSMRREWIEIHVDRIAGNDLLSPSMRREWIEMFQGHELDKEHLGLPPCGGSGLK